MICIILAVIIYILISYGVMTWVVKARGRLDTIDKILYGLSPVVLPLVIVVTIVFKIKDLYNSKK